MKDLFPQHGTVGATKSVLVVEIYKVKRIDVSLISSVSFVMKLKETKLRQ